jgi:hypothetical protein
MYTYAATECERTLKPKPSSFTANTLHICTLAGLGLTTHNSNLLDGRQRPYHYVDHAARTTEAQF